MLTWVSLVHKQNGMKTEDGVRKPFRENTRTVQRLFDDRQTLLTDTVLGSRVCLHVHLVLHLKKAIYMYMFQTILEFTFMGEPKKGGEIPRLCYTISRLRMYLDYV